MAKKFLLSQVGRYPENSLNIKYHTISKVLNNTQEVLDFISPFLGEYLDGISLHDLDIFVGRRRFAATLIENVLTVADFKKAREKTIFELTSSLKKCWKTVHKKLVKEHLKTVKDLIHLSTRLLKAYMVIYFSKKLILCLRLLAVQYC